MRQRKTIYGGEAFDFFLENILKTPLRSFSLPSFLLLMIPLASLSLELSADMRCNADICGVISCD